MAETALNETGQHGRSAVPLAAQPPLLRTTSPSNAWWSVPVARTDAARATRPDLWQSNAGGAEPVRYLARAWLTALAVSSDATPGKRGNIPGDLATAHRFLTAQSAALVSIMVGSPFRPRQAAAVGQALVQADFTGGDVLGRSLRVLLLRLPEVFSACTKAPDVLGDMEQRVAAVTEALANGYVGALRDAERMISEELRHQATHDALTGLPNRTVAFGRLSAAIAAGGNNRIGLCYLDLDGFKAVNDRYGHDAGDELLVTVARRIGGVARAHGTLAARIGGDEFVVLTEFSPGVAGMIALVTDILAEVSRPVALRIGRVGVSACAGIADHVAGSPGAAGIVADADAALYLAKSRGPGRWVVHDPARRRAS